MPSPPPDQGLSWQSPHGRRLPAIGSRTLVMGILNITPDSFSDGGKLNGPDALRAVANEMITNGADVLDIGGESTRPGAQPVSASMELDRILPAIAVVRKHWPEIPLSIDTSKAEVAQAAISAGADIINDVWGLTAGFGQKERDLWRARPHNSTDASFPVSAMAATVASLGCPVIIMHNRPANDYGIFWDDLISDLQMSLHLAHAAGVASGQIWLDPGFGFAKNVPQNLEVLRDLGRIVKLGFPVVVGTSRKSTIGRVLDVPTDQRIVGTGVTAAWAIQQGCSMLRVHDVVEMRQYIRMADAIKAGLTFPTQ